MIHVDARYLGLTANQLAKIATDLKAENAELRDEIDHLLIKRQYTEDVNTKLRELAQRLFTEYRYMRVRPRRMYLEHETRMRIIEDEMRELGIEVPDGEV